MSEQNARYTYLVPRDTAAFLTSGVNMSRCENMNLILARYIPQEVIRNDTVGKYDKARDIWLKDTTRRFNTQQRRDWQALAEANFVRWQAQTDARNILSFEGQLEDHMMVGLGGESVLENSLTLGMVNGLPFIPGSALKGIARAYALFVIANRIGVPVLVGDDLLNYIGNSPKSKTTPLDVLDELLALPYDTEKAQEAWQEKFNDLNDNPYQQTPVDSATILENEDAAIFRLIFGSQTKAGVCVFYDAVLSNLPDGQLFVVDVMTPHYPDYYGSDGATPPSDDQGPNPIQFMAVSRGTRFGFAIGLAQKRMRDADVAPDKLMETAEKWLKRGLRDLGAGAKTHAGYGLFRILK